MIFLCLRFESLEVISKLLTVNRHLNCSLIFITQALFHNSSAYRIASSNTKYFICFVSRRTSQSVKRLLEQCFSKDHVVQIMEVFRRLAREKFNYLIIDFGSQICDSLRIRSHLFHGPYPRVYLLSDRS